MNRVALEVDRAVVGYGPVPVVDGVSIRLDEGEFLSLIGPNGAGKTTLMNALSGALALRSGRVWYFGQDISNWSEDARARAGLGRSFQKTHLFPRLTVLENVRIAVLAKRRVRFRALWSPQDPAVDREAHASLAAAGLTEHADRPAADLPHGGKRRLELAMLFALEPRVLLLDEPTAGMGAEEADGLMRVIDGWRRDRGCSVMLVEHRLDLVMRLSDRVAVLHQGRLLTLGSPEAVMADPEVEAAYLGGRVERA
ncbi:ABC transporter ATP-binding protein [Alicyclobacillus sp.]|uniref:ABC transporter ATP-binding protein n=1 Tax=Alicyclobacillus sp. TaxID=61169 RepID=UPI0025C29C38|nr:ABC transporter ATP-binding protein [Alicyclobacillus sp.]MCL6517369.1 ABC transporter ATP-binding protein [Alicyclobacillus sp.]